MAYLLDFPLNLGPTRTDPAQVVAELTAFGGTGGGAVLPSPTLSFANDVSHTYFKHRGNGCYHFSPGSPQIPDDFRGMLYVLYGGVVLAPYSVNPQEAEYQDVKTSSRALDSDMTTLLGRLSALRAGYLDFLNIGGNVASAAQVSNISNATYVSTNITQILQRPASGTQAVPLEVIFKGTNGSPQDLDASALPTVTLTDSLGNSLAGRLSVWAHAATGKYTATYTNSSTDPVGSINWDLSGTVGGLLRQTTTGTQIVDAVATDFTASDRDNLNTILGRVPGSVAQDADAQTLLARISSGRAALLDNLAELDAAVTSRMAGSAGTALAAAVAALPTTLLDEALIGHTGADSVGESLRYARAQAAGRWVIAGNQFQLYDLDGVTLLRTLQLVALNGAWVERY